MLENWQFWALLSAGFAALTAILAKIGVATIDSDLATLLRTCVILIFLTAFVTMKDGWKTLSEVSPNATVFLVLSGLATGASWLCYFRALKLGDASRVAPVDKLSVVFVAVFGVFLLGEILSVIHWAGIGLITFGAILLTL